MRYASAHETLVFMGLVRGLMRTHIELDDKTLNQVMRLGKFETKKAAINTALSEFARSLKRKELLNLGGSIRWEGNLDVLRANRQTSTSK
jgi:Arc/MetJ family transcription regulator